jgi:hypothetical protein
MKAAEAAEAALRGGRSDAVGAAGAAGKAAHMAAQTVREVAQPWTKAAQAAADDVLKAAVAVALKAYEQTK